MTKSEAPRQAPDLPDTDQTPRVWLLMGHKAGDNTQVQALADALGWPYEIKRLVYHRYELVTNLLLGATLAGVNNVLSSRLGPPWPDLVISAGRRNEPIAQWIRKRAGGAVRLVHMGRPWAALERFDLIVTTPQYQLPERSNILPNLLPLHQITSSRLEAAAQLWAPKFAHLSRPWYAVMFGGDSGPFVFTPEKGACLGHQVNRLASRDGGSLLVSESARTPAAAFEAFNAELTVPRYEYRWRAADRNNPYLGYLALADSIVVTGESMSMVTEASATGKPLILFDPGDRPCGAELHGVYRPWWLIPHNYRYKPLTHRLATRLAPRRMRRDIGAMQQQLVASGRAVWLGQAPLSNTQSAPSEDLERAVQRVRGLLAG